MTVLSPALTVTRSFVHQATGKHTLLLTSKAYNKRSTSFPEKPTKPKCPRVTYLCLISPCRSPSSSLTLVRARVDRYMCIHMWCWICVYIHKHTVFHLSMGWRGIHCSFAFLSMFLHVCCVFLHKMKCLFHMEIHMLLNRPHPIPEPSLGFPTIPGGGGQWPAIQVPVLQ